MDFKGHSRSIPGRCPFCYCHAKSISRHIKCCFKNPRSKYYDPDNKCKTHRHGHYLRKIRCPHCKLWFDGNTLPPHLLKCKKFDTVQKQKYICKNSLKIFNLNHLKSSIIFQHSTIKKWDIKMVKWPKYGHLHRDIFIPQLKTVVVIKYQGDSKILQEMQQQLYSEIKGQGLECLLLQPPLKISSIKKKLDGMFQARSFTNANEQSIVSDRTEHKQFQWAI